MINAGAEVTMTRTHAIFNELVYELQALEVRSGMFLQSLFGDIFQIRNACHQVAQIVHRLPLSSPGDITHIYTPFQFVATRV